MRSVNNNLTPTGFGRDGVGIFPQSGARHGRGITLRASETEDSGPSSSEIRTAMQAARDCEAVGLSPGAGLSDSEAQAEAAFADMINTTVDVTGEALGAEELENLAKGGMMDKSSTSKKSGSLFDDVKDLFGALSKGAHIVKQKNGRV